MNDTDILNGLLGDYKQRIYYEKEFYQRYGYFIKEGCRKYNLTNEDSSSAYNDAVLSVITNVVNNRFDNKASLKTYLFQVFHNKCVDFIRKISNNKQQVHHSTGEPELLSYLPDEVKSVVEKLIYKENIARVTRHLEEIDEKCKKILLLYAEGYSDEKIAEKTGYNSTAVAKTTRMRCREKMIKLFANNG